MGWADTFFQAEVQATALSLNKHNGFYVLCFSTVWISFLMSVLLLLNWDDVSMVFQKYFYIILMDRLLIPIFQSCE